MEVEKYIVLGSTTEIVLANRTCAALENANIPVMIEHAEAAPGSKKKVAFRILVPLHYAQAARRISDNALLSFEDRPGSKTLLPPVVAAGSAQ